MSLICLLVCHSVQSPSHSFSSYSVSSSDAEGGGRRCSSITTCLTKKAASFAQLGSNTNIASSKVTPEPVTPSNGVMMGPPRLVRSRAVRRDIVRDWNFDQVPIER